MAINGPAPKASGCSVAKLLASFIVLGILPLLTIFAKPYALLETPPAVTYHDNLSTDMHIAYSICGGSRGFSAVNSLLYARAVHGSPATLTRRLHLHIAVDEETNSTLPNSLAFRRLLSYAEQTPEVVIHLHCFNTMAPETALFTNLFKKCGGGRLRLLLELQDLPRLLYLDWDTTIHCDLGARWDSVFDAMEAAGSGLAMGPEGLYGADGHSAGWYIRARVSLGVPGGYNSGVLAVRSAYFSSNTDAAIDRTSLRGLLAEFADIVSVGGVGTFLESRGIGHSSYDLPLGDQDLLNAAAVLHPGLVSLLPLPLNWRHGVAYDVDDIGPEGVIRLQDHGGRRGLDKVKAPKFVEGETCVVHLCAGKKSKAGV